MLFVNYNLIIKIKIDKRIVIAGRFSCYTLFVPVDTLCMVAISGNYRSNTLYYTQAQINNTLPRNGNMRNHTIYNQCNKIMF